MTERRKLQKDLAQLDAEHEMLQVQQEECASQMEKVDLLFMSAPCREHGLSPDKGPFLSC